MIHFRKPDHKQNDAFRAAQSELAVTYSPVGATATTPPAGYVVDHTRVTLGRGDSCFDAARGAFETWQQFELGWLCVASSDVPIHPGEVVIVLANVFGVWAMCACRIVYLVDDAAPIRRFGFAYGTLPGHPESGEERFLIEIDEEGNVMYDVFAFSKPHHPLAKLGYPIVRRIQKRFAADSAAALKRFVEKDAT